MWKESHVKMNESHVEINESYEGITCENELIIYGNK